MSRQVSPATGRVYGLERVTRIWGVSRATVYRHRRPAAVTRKRPGPLGAMADEALVPPVPLPVSSSATITAASTSATISRPRSASLASGARRPSCASPRATAAPSGLFAC